MLCSLLLHKVRAKVKVGRHHGSHNGSRIKAKAKETEKMARAKGKIIKDLAKAARAKAHATDVESTVTTSATVHNNTRV